MPRPESDSLTPREAQIMAVLWRLGPCTAGQVRSGLPDDAHDSTVRTLLRVLETKGCVNHKTKGKAYVYRAQVKRSAAERKAVQSMLERFFGGSAEALVQRLLADEELTPEQLEHLRAQYLEHEERPGKRARHKQKAD